MRSLRRGVLGNRAALRAELGLPDGKLIGMVSALQESRRHELAVDAMVRVRAKHPSAHLVALGDGERSATIRARVISLGLKDAVTFTG